jgi:predicted enzyme related to lactoylglutathione lyase
MMLKWRKEAKRPTKGGGLFLYIKVDDVEDFYKAVTAWGGRPSSEPRRMPTGTERSYFATPDGYKFVSFAEK